jgi:hypothetical protein
MWSGKGLRFTCQPVASAVLLGLSLFMMAGCGGNAASMRSTQGTQGQGTQGQGDDLVQLRVGKTAVLTHHNDGFRSGINLTETTLTPDNVGPSTFGRLAAFPVQGNVYAQPLYVPNVSMSADRIANLVIVATQHDQLYAFDVDSKALAWHTDYLAAGPNVSTLSTDDVFGCQDITPEIGITGTPVIDPVTRTLYVLVRTKEVVGGATVFYQRLHAVDLSTGKDLLPPTVVTGPPPNYPATGTATFNPLLNNQRAALMLAHQQVYVAWASHCDYGQYTGWLMSFAEATLQPTAYWTPVPYSAQGGIWMSGSGPSVDENGDIYVPVANGGEDDLIGPKNNFRSSLVRLQWSATGGFSVADYFAPYNYQMMDDKDWDFGTSGALLLPEQPGTAHPHLVVVRDKLALTYVLDRDNLGKWQDSDNSQAVQTFQVLGSGLSSVLFWNSTLYMAGGWDYLKAYNFNPTTQQFDPTPQVFLNDQMDSRPSTPSLSADGDSNAMLWIISDFEDGKHAVLHALDALDISTELYNSNMMPARDMAGVGVKFVVPTVADGLVFVGTQNEVDMYGLLTQ